MKKCLFSFDSNEDSSSQYKFLAAAEELGWNFLLSDYMFN